MAAALQVEIIGLSELRAAVRTLGRDGPRALTRAHRGIAEMVAADARRRAPLGPTGRLRRSIRAGATQRHALVRGGGPRVPYFYGQEFGSLAYPQFPPWRGNQWQAGSGPAAGVGYMIHPAVSEMRPRVVGEYLDHLEKVLVRAWRA